MTYRDVLRQAAPGCGSCTCRRAARCCASGSVRAEGTSCRPSLLDSQAATLEPLAEGEHGVTVDVGQPVDAVVDDALRGLGLSAQRTTGA
nr:hypothetical protein [Angustibacter aerolatus]